MTPKELCLDKLKRHLAEQNPAPDRQLQPSVLFVINAGYSAGRLDAVSDVAKLWRKAIEDLDIAEMVLNPHLFINKLQWLIDEYSKEGNLFEDVYNGNEPGATEEAPKIIVG